MWEKELIDAYKNTDEGALILIGLFLWATPLPLRYTWNGKTVFV